MRQPTLRGKGRDGQVAECCRVRTEGQQDMQRALQARACLSDSTSCSAQPPPRPAGTISACSQLHQHFRRPQMQRAPLTSTAVGDDQQAAATRGQRCHRLDGSGIGRFSIVQHLLRWKAQHAAKRVRATDGTTSTARSLRSTSCLRFAT